MESDSQFAFGHCQGLRFAHCMAPFSGVLYIAQSVALFLVLIEGMLGLSAPPGACAFVLAWILILGFCTLHEGRHCP